MRKIDYISYIKEFGVGVFVLKTIRHLTFKSNSKFSWKINEWNEKKIEKVLFSEYKDNVSTLPDLRPIVLPNVPNNPIFVMWYQGWENPPKVVQCCFNGLRKYNNGHDVIALSEQNIKDYVKLPDYIYQKYNDGLISKQHLADIIRCALLYLYGGCWIDATVLLTKNLPDCWFEKDFYSIHFGKYTKDPSHGRWTTFMMAAKLSGNGHELISEILRYQLGYWKKHQQAVDYIMFDYFIDNLVKKNPQCASAANNVEINNENVFDLKAKLDLSIKEEKSSIDAICQNTYAHKLNWRYHGVGNSESVFNCLMAIN